MLKVKVELKESKGRGIGAFSAQFIPKNTKIWEFTQGMDVRIFGEDEELLDDIGREFLYKYGYLENNTWTICIDEGRHFNHSSHPNTYDNEEGTFALKDINVGEEITTNYFEICDWNRENGLNFIEL